MTWLDLLQTTVVATACYAVVRKLLTTIAKIAAYRYLCGVLERHGWPPEDLDWSEIAEELYSVAEVRAAVQREGGAQIYQFQSKEKP